MNYELDFSSLRPIFSWYYRSYWILLISEENLTLQIQLVCPDKNILILYLVL